MYQKEVNILPFHCLQEEYLVAHHGYVQEVALLRGIFFKGVNMFLLKDQSITEI
jgi:hypothetical protein